MSGATAPGANTRRRRHGRTSSTRAVDVDRCRRRVRAMPFRRPSRAARRRARIPLAGGIPRRSSPGRLLAPRGAHARCRQTLHFPDGSARENRMQGNDFVQSLMYARGVTCASCHDPHGTPNNADLIKSPRLSASRVTARKSPNGPHTATIEQHTHHQPGRRVATAWPATCRRLPSCSAMSWSAATPSSSSFPR